MPSAGTPTEKLTVTIVTANGTTVTKTYDIVSGFAETATEKSFTGKRSGETADGIITVNKAAILDEKREPV